MIILSAIIAFGVGVLVGRMSLRAPKVDVSFEVPSKEDEQAILRLFEDKEQIQNSDVREALKVSEATAVRYLDALEQKGAITQQGKTGRNTFYTKN